MKHLLAVTMLLTACIATPENDPAPMDTAMIAVSSGGFHGQSGTQIFGDDRVVTTGFHDGRATQSTQRTIPGAYARAAAVIRTEGHRVMAQVKIMTQVKPEAPICMDYGQDIVQAQPPVAGFDAASVGCPNPAVTTLIADILATLAPP